MAKNLFLQTPSAGDIEELFTEGAKSLSLPTFPGTPAPATATTTAPPATTTATPPDAPAAPAASAPAAPTVRAAAPTRDDLIRRATQLGVNPKFALEIFGLESSGNWNSRDSNVGAVGGMQVMPDTYKMMMGSYAGQRDPWNNMEAGLRYIAYGQKKLGTDDPALLAAGYQSGYDRKSLQQGIIPNTTDGGMTTKAYAARIAGRMGLASPANSNDASSATNLQGQLDKEEPGRYKVLDPAEAQRLQAQQALDDEGPGRYRVLTQQELDKLPARAFADITPDVPKGPESSGFVEDFSRMGLGGIYKGIGSGVRGLGKIPQILGDYTTTPVVNWIFGTNYRTGNVADVPADAIQNFAQRVQAGVSKETQTALEKSRPDGSLIDPKSWTFGKDPSVRGYMMLGADVLGSTAPIIAASILSGGSAVAGATAGGLTGGGAGVEAAREAVKDMSTKMVEVDDGKGGKKEVSQLEAESATYRAYRAQGMSHSEALQRTQDAAEKWAFVLTTPVSAMGGAVTSKILHPAEHMLGAAGNRAVRAGGRAVLGGLEEAIQEPSETVTARTGVNLGAGTNIDVTEGTFGDAVLGALGGVGPAGVAGAASPRAPHSAKPGPQQNGPAPSGGPEASGPAPAAPSGPIGRAMERATGANPDQQAPQTATQPAAATEAGNVVTGDDGTQYRITTGADGVTLEQIAQPPAAAPAAQAEQTPAEKAPAEQPKKPEPAPAAPETSDETKAAAPSAPAPREEKAAERPLTDWSEQELRDRMRYLAQQAKNNGGWNKMLSTERRKVSGEIDRRNEGAPAPSEPVTVTPVEQTTAGTTLTPEQITKNKQDTLYPHVLGMLQGRNAISPQEIMAATDVAYNRAARVLETAQAEGHVGPIREDGTRAVTLKTEANNAPGVPANSGADNGRGTAGDRGAAAADQSAKPGVSSTDSAARTGESAAAEAPALKDQYAGKWFGSREKAQAFVDKKNAAGTHEIVQTGKVRFEIKPKVAEGMERFAPETGTLGIPREEMPQVPTQSHGALTNHLNAQGIEHETKMVPAAELKPTQAEFSPEKVAQAKEATGDRSVIVSNDGHIIDGHHQALAAAEEGKDVKAIVLDAPVDQALEAVKNSPSAQQSEQVYRSMGEARDALKKAGQDTHEIVRVPRGMAVRPKESAAKNSPSATTEQSKHDQIDQQFAENRAALPQFKKGMRVEFTQPGEFKQPDGTVREGRPVAGVVDAIQDKQQGIVRVKEGEATWSVGARMLRAADAEKRSEAANQTPAEPTPPTNGGKDRFAGNKIFKSDAVEKARERLKKKLSGSQLNSGIDPEIVQDGITIAGAYIESGVRDFAAYAKAMTDDLGHAIKPYLLSFWEAARNYPGLDAEGMTSVEDSKRLHSELMTPEVKAQAAEAIGEPVEKPAKRTRKTGGAADRTLTQDWGVDHIDGYDGREETKDAFLKESRDYLRSVTSQLAEQGYSPLPDAKGRPRKAVSVNEAGPAVSGEVSLSLYNPEIGRGIYAQVSGTALRGTVPTTQSGISIMFRGATEADPYGARSTNRWAPTDLSAADLAILLDKEARSIAKQSPSSTMKSKEVTQNDRSATDGNPDEGAAKQGAGRVSPDEGGRLAADVAEQPRRDNTGSDQRGTAERGKQSGVDGQPAVRGEPADANAGNQLGAEVGRGDGARAGDGNDRGPVSRVGNDYRIQPGELTRTGSWRATAEQNVRIVELVKQLEKEGRRPTPEEAALLTKFNGWGASEIANGVFPDKYGRYKDSNWQALGERLKTALTPEEYDQAKRTMQYAHYTTEGVIGSIYDALQRMGFAGGKMLEPGMGIGRFKGLMPASMNANSQYTGVEYDGLTGAIAKLLYPQSNIVVGDYTKTAMPREFFDAAIGNPPFGNITITNDPEYKKQGFLLHDYFFAKTLDRVKPGGLVTFITSNGTMDKAGDRARRYLADRANLVGAIRLPQTAFKDNAGTEVVTDVLFLQKRGPGIEDNGVKWLGTAEVQTPQGATPINEYFAAHPEMVLGAHALTGSMYRANSYTVVPEPGVDMDAAFAKAVANLPEGIYQPGAQNPAASKAVALERDFNPTHKKEGGLYVSDDGRLMQVDSGSGIDLNHRRGADGKQIALKPADKAFLKSWVGLRDALKQAQLDQLSDGNWETSLKALSAAYDAFAAKHGNLLAYSTIERKADDGTVTVTKRFKNDPLLRLDVDGALAYSLEHIKENGDIVKAPVLSERVLQRPREPEIKTTNDALFVSLNNKGSLDLDDVAKLSNMSRQEVIDALGTSIYEDPAKSWQTADAYLSGNVVRKLREAQSAARSDRKYARNVEALLAVQPKPLGPTEITVKLGQNWIPSSDVKAFAKEALNENIDVSYNSRLGNWSAEQTGSNYSEFNTPRMNAGQILDAVLNNRQIKVTFRDQEGKTHVDPEATEKAIDVATKMRAAFQRWIWTDTGRADRLVNHYNDNFNNIAPRKFDGSHLTLPGVSMRFDLRENQKRAIWRGIQEGDMYLAHAVGAGKTFTMIATGMEERRLGLSNKPMYVVPNHMLAQFAREFLELYPAANIMVADEQNFHTHNRRRFVAQAALNNPDAVIITHSAFGRIGMSDEYASQFLSDQIDEWRTALDETDKSDRITRKQIERRIEQLERRLEARQSGEKKDKVLSFEELGVDRLFVDEAHEFRKLDFATQQGNIKGIDPSGSQRALDLYMKTQYLREKKPGRALVMASGTPITNTMGELYTVQRFFQPEQMAEDGLDTFDAWANQYGDVTAGFEQNAAGGYEVVSRFAKFQNVPELMRRVRSFMDILTSSALSQYVDRPAVEGGGRQIMVTPEPFGYKAYQKSLEERIAAIRRRKGPPQKGQDIILKVIADGRFSAIDMRFVDPSAPSDPNSKLNQMLDAVIKSYHETADNEYTTNGKVDPIKGASHIIFTDIGLGEQSAANRGFDMKQWIEQQLVDGGVKREHIAFMRDNKEHAKKERLFSDMREGKKRILIGGKDMETGVNVQKRLSTEEHLDAPWFPASVEQREGRIVRQGNQNKRVGIRAWATKGSYDSTMWGMNGRKARFIEQALNGDDSVRSLEDVSEASAFEMAAALASGDERYLRMAGLKADVERLERLSYAHHDDQNKLRRDKHWAETQIQRDTDYAAELKDAIAKRVPVLAGQFDAKVGKVGYDNREEFSRAIFNRFKDLASKEADTAEQIGEIGGFPIMFHGTQLKGSGEYIAAVSVDLPGDPSPLVQLPLDPDMPVAGIATRAANQVNALDRQLVEAEGRVAQNQRKIDNIGNRLGATFPEQAELLEKMQQLNGLEAELTAEKANENAPAPSADAAAATLEADGEKPTSAAADLPQSSRSQVLADRKSEGKYSVGEGGRMVAEFGPVYDEFKNDPAAAIKQLMDAKGGEAVAAVTLPGIGEVSLIYGDKAAGLAHIAAKRGDEWLAKLPDLLKNGTVYSKVGHSGRVYIGTPDSEATIRLDWDGKAKTWLVTAFDRHADKKAPFAELADNGSGASGTTNLEGLTQDGRIPQPDRSDVIKPNSEGVSNEQNVTAISNILQSGPLGGIVSDLIAQNRVVLHETADTLPVKNAPTSVRGVTTEDGTIHLVAANLTPETALSVLLHEAFHEGGERLIGTPAWADLLKRLDGLHRQAEQSGGRAREFYNAARERVASAQQSGVVPESLTAEEFGAYTIEHYDQAPAAFRKWVDDVIGAMKAWALRRFGKQLGDVTPAQLRALAAAALRGAPDTTPGPRFSVNPNGTASPAPAGLTPPAPSRFERFQATVQDNMNRVKKVQERIMKLTGTKDLGYGDYYGAESNRPGRIAARLEDAKKALTGPLMERLAKSGHKLEELEELLHAQHAQERNERIAAINTDMPDGGSGMTTAEANAILAKYQDATELKAMAQQARDISRATLDLKVAYGLISQEDHDALSKAYDFYVPLKGDGEYGPKVKRAMGHEERDEHILENIARDYDQAVVVGEKNLARQSLLALVAEHPDNDLWTIGVPPRGRYIAGKVYNVVDNGKTIGSFVSRSQVNAFLEGAGPKAATYQVLDSNGERVAEFVKPLQDNEVMVYVKGEPVRIQINDEALAQQIRPLDQTRMHPILEFMRGVNRYLSKIYTGYNPSFILRNAARDALTGTINMVGNEGAAVAGQSWKKYPAALLALGQWAKTGKVPAGKMGELLKEYREQGGKTGASWMSDLEEQGKSLTRMYDDAYGARGYLKDGENMKAAKVAGRKIVAGMAHVVEIGNQATENALRLALYATLRERGVKAGEAARAAKNVTVDFDRKGTMTPALGAIYLFLNPAIQGTANALRTVATGKHRNQALIALGMLATLGFFAAGAGMDDDKDRWLGENWETRTKNFMFGIGTHTLRVPLSQEFAPAYAVGVAMAEAMRGESAMKSAARLVSSFIGAYFPMNGAYSPDSDNHSLDAFLAMTPTIIKPAAETAANRNTFGSQIVPETDATKGQPDNLKMFRGTKGSVYDRLAQGIAAGGEVVGANRYENDITKVSPETLKYLWRTYTGGLGQFVTDSIGVTGMAAADLGSVGSNDVPLVKDFWKQNDVKAIRSRFFDLAKEAREAQDELKAAKKARDGEALPDIFERPGQAELIGSNKVFTRTSKAVAAIRDEQARVNVDKTLSTAERNAKLKELEKQEELLERGALDAFAK